MFRIEKKGKCNEYPIRDRTPILRFFRVYPEPGVEGEFDDLSSFGPLPYPRGLKNVIGGYVDTRELHFTPRRYDNDRDGGFEI